MNNSEREVADVLDSLHLAWEYEPRLFAFKKDENGFIKEGFQPDFYVPAYDCYIEVTMAKQANTTGKHRKVRILKELYPDTYCEVVHRGDFANLREVILGILKRAQEAHRSAF